MIAIRTDANKTIATGHIMRCITIADEIKNLGKEVTFYVSDDESASYLSDKGYDAFVLKSDWSNPIAETEAFADMLSENDTQVVLFDSYSFSDEYFKKLRSHLKKDIRIAYMDDLGDETYSVNMLINYNVYADELDYEHKYGDDTVILKGPVYAPLRPQFFGRYEHHMHIPVNVLIAAGGGDVSELITDILKQALEDDNVKKADLHVVLGSKTEDQNELMRIAWLSDNVFLHRQVTEMASLMSKCDIAVSAAGTMMTELCCMQIPTIEFYIADNQKKNADHYAKRGIMIGVGDMQHDKEVVIKRLVRELSGLIEDKKRLQQMRDSMKDICDGQGAHRIAEALCS